MVDGLIGVAVEPKKWSDRWHGRTVRESPSSRYAPNLGDAIRHASAALAVPMTDDHDVGRERRLGTPD